MWFKRSKYDHILMLFSQYSLAIPWRQKNIRPGAPRGRAWWREGNGGAASSVAPGGGELDRHLSIRVIFGLFFLNPSHRHQCHRHLGQRVAGLLLKLFWGGHKKSLQRKHFSHLSHLPQLCKFQKTFCTLIVVIHIKRENTAVCTFLLLPLQMLLMYRWILSSQVPQLPWMSDVQKQEGWGTWLDIDALTTCL